MRPDISLHGKLNLFIEDSQRAEPEMRFFYPPFQIAIPQKRRYSKTNKMAGPTGVPVAQTVSTSKPFKQPFHAIAQASHKSGYLTKPVDPAINKTIDVFSSLYKGIKKYVDKFPKIHPYILLFIALVVSGTVSFFLLIPAVIFFPITIALGIGTAFAAVALGPLVFIGSWLLISSAPAQAKIVKPFLDETLKNQKVAKLLLLE